MTVIADHRYGPLEWDRAHRAPSTEDLFGWQYTPTARLPDPDPLLRNISLAAVECLAGIRKPEQLGRWLMPAVSRQLVRRHRDAVRFRAPGEFRLSRTGFRLLSYRRTYAAPGAVEGVAVVSNGHRARAVVVHLEGIDRRWRATFLHVL